MTTLDSLIEKYGAPSYIKIDVEGYELEVIKGLSTSVQLISVECNLPVFKRETLEIIDRLSARDPTATYNFSVTEPPAKFEKNAWLTKDEIVKIVDEERFGFMEIYCRAAAEFHGTATGF